jgi:2'-5' RNA ligase
MRSFVALELKDEEVRSRLIGLQGKLMETQADLKPVEPQNMHITLKFLGRSPRRPWRG